MLKKLNIKQIKNPEIVQRIDKNMVKSEFLQELEAVYLKIRTKTKILTEKEVESWLFKAKHRIADLEERDEKLQARRTEAEKKANELKSEVSKLEQKLENLRNNICMDCSFYLEAEGISKITKEETNFFICDVCEEQKSGTITQMRIIRPPIPKTKLCNICLDCKDKVKEVVESRIIFPGERED